MKIAMEQDKARLGYIHTRDSDSWFTPKKYIDKVKRVFNGDIELDPFSSEDANKLIKATTYFDKEQNGLLQKWDYSNIFLNPPYSRGMMQSCVNKIIKEIDYKQNLILLANASTDSKWFHQLLEISTIQCLTLGRIAFYNVDGKSMKGNTKGQCFFLISSDSKVCQRFIDEFNDVGKIFKLI